MVPPNRFDREVSIKALLTDVVTRAHRYLTGLPARPVAPSAAALAALKEFATPLQAHPLVPARVLEELDDIGSPATVATAGGRFFGFVIGVPRFARDKAPAPLAANILAAERPHFLGTHPVGIRRSMG